MVDALVLKMAQQMVEWTVFVSAEVKDKHSAVRLGIEKVSQTAGEMAD